VGRVLVYVRQPCQERRIKNKRTRVNKGRTSSTGKEGEKMSMLRMTHAIDVPGLDALPPPSSPHSLNSLGSDCLLLAPYLLHSSESPYSLQQTRAISGYTPRTQICIIEIPLPLLLSISHISNALKDINYSS
jgi:hypothetical protein